MALVAAVRDVCDNVGPKVLQLPVYEFVVTVVFSAVVQVPELKGALSKRTAVCVAEIFLI